MTMVAVWRARTTVWEAGTTALASMSGKSLKKTTTRMAGGIMSSMVLIMLTTRMKKADLRRSCKRKKKRDHKSWLIFFLFSHLIVLLALLTRFDPCSFFHKDKFLTVKNMLLINSTSFSFLALAANSMKYFH
jgi:hypothetical protein